MSRMPRRRSSRRRARGPQSWIGVAAAAALAAPLLLAGCGDDGGIPTLTWYINPDPNPPDNFSGAFGQAGIAERCSTDEYEVETELLPTSASEQRIQLLRRLSADDPSIDLMSLDPVFTAEFAEAGGLGSVVRRRPGRRSPTASSQGAIDGATWNDQLVVAPLWANTQVLWYRKHVADEAGLDMTQPVTWDQIIDAADETGTFVGVQANKYEGYVVWINALVVGAGGDIVSDTAAGSDATIDIGSEAGAQAATIIRKLADSSASMPDLSVSNEGTVLGAFATDKGGFQVNWTFVYNNYVDSDIIDDLGWARYPETVAGQESRPPIGGINVGDRGVHRRARIRRRGRAVHHVRGEPGAVRRGDGEHAGPRGGVRRSGAAGAVPGRPARAVPHVDRHGRAPSGVGRTGRPSSTPRWPSGTPPTR